MDRQRIPRFQSDWYRSQYKMSLHILLLLSCISLLLACFIGWLLLFKKLPPVYYAAVTDGEVVLMNPETKGG